MIRFTCRCSHQLELPDDQAGLSTQCPRCGLLLDVPTLSDLEALNTDGTYRLDATSAPRPNAHLDELTRVYYPGRQSPDGSDIDLRGPVRPRGEKIPPRGEPDEPVPAERPRYDPETGELIMPVEVHEPGIASPASGLPTAERVISYGVTTESHGFGLHALGVFAQLFTPVNMVVMGVVLALHLFLVVSGLVTILVPFVFLAPMLVIVVLIGHYAMLVEEMGPSERDELPRPLRNVHLYDDLLAPLGHMMGALLLCYWPSLVIIIANFVAFLRGQSFPFPHTRELHLALFAIGSALFPATLLTIATSGTILNLRPDRIIGTISTIGLRYPFLVVLWIVACGACLVGQAAATLNLVAIFTLTTATMPVLAEPYVAYPLLIAGVYLMHAFGWALGLEYRRSHAYLPWTLQHHTHIPEQVHRPAPKDPRLLAAEKAAKARAAKRARSQVR